MFRPLRDVPYLASVATLAVLLIAASALALTSGGSDDVTPPSDAASPTGTAAPPTPEATATSAASYGDVLADSKRMLDLAAVAVVLEQFHAREGQYPATFGPVELTCTEGSDPGCELLALEAQLPLFDGAEPYWYQSDGAAYTLFTTLSVAAQDDACPLYLPPALEGGAVGCVAGGGE